MITNDIKKLDTKNVAYILERGGTFLRSARSAAFRTPEGRKKAYENLKKHGIDALVVIGGDGSLTGAHLLFEEYKIPSIGLPGTIDNDLSGTDSTIGFDTACNTAIQAIDKIRDTASSHDRLFFVEVMGRDAGFIAINAGIGSGAAATLIPERKMPIENLIKRLDRKSTRLNSSHVRISYAVFCLKKKKHHIDSQLLHSPNQLLPSRLEHIPVCSGVHHSNTPDFERLNQLTPHAGTDLYYLELANP